MEVTKYGEKRGPSRSGSKLGLQSKKRDAKSEEKKGGEGGKLESALPEALAVSGTVNQSKVLSKFNPMNRTTHMSKQNLQNLDHKIQLYNHNSSFKLPGINATGTDLLRRS